MVTSSVIINPVGDSSVFTNSDGEYGIKEIIDLLKHIPKDQDAIFGAEMIKRTLSSMKISITDILDDAVDKEIFGKRKIEQLQEEIEIHLKQVELLKTQIQHLNEELTLVQQATSNLTINDKDLLEHCKQRLTRTETQLPGAAAATMSTAAESLTQQAITEDALEPAKEDTSETVANDANKKIEKTQEVAAEETQVIDIDAAIEAEADALNQAMPTAEASAGVENKPLETSVSDDFITTEMADEDLLVETNVDDLISDGEEDILFEQPRTQTSTNSAQASQLDSQIDAIFEDEEVQQEAERDKQTSEIIFR